MSRRHLNAVKKVIEEVVLTELSNEEVQESIIDDYEKLNVKCDTIISKIKNRKGKKNQPSTT